MSGHFVSKPNKRGYIARTTIPFLALGLCLFPTIAQALPHQEWSEVHAIYPLPGQLNTVPMVNSNSPEIVTSEGILVSTLPPSEPGDEDIYLNHALAGRFQIFAHHGVEPPNASGQMHMGLLLSNPQDIPVQVRLLRGHSFLMQPDAPYRSLPSLISGLESMVFSGPGDRLVAHVLNQSENPLNQPISIPGQVTKLVQQWPIPVDWRWMRPRRNVRSTLLELESTDRVYASLVAAWVPNRQTPAAETFARLLIQRQLAGTREPQPTPVEFHTPIVSENFRYGRVAGVSEGTEWQSSILGSQAPLGYLKPKETVGFPIAAVHLKRLGTLQNQSGRLLKRYADTAYQAHGNYGVRYTLHADFRNEEKATQIYHWRLSHPLRVMPKPATPSLNQVFYARQHHHRVVFRGSIRVDWNNQHHWHHVVLKEGQKGPLFFTLEVPPQEHHQVSLEFIYPPDCIPPQLLSIERER